jgi:hypothetical protein
MADLHAPLGDEASEEMLHLVVDHAIVSALQLIDDLGNRALPVTQAEDVSASPIQQHNRFRTQQHVLFSRPIERQPDVGRQFGTARR